MKEFIDKLIERLEEEAVEIYREPTVNDAPCSGLIPTGDKDILLSKVKKIVNELAEEYKEDCCEWKWGLDYAQVQCMGDKILFGTRRLFTYCPYCGKKIKVAPYTEGE